MVSSPRDCQHDHTGDTGKEMQDNKDNKDLSQSWTEKDIAESQRELVDRQLAAMHAGNAPAHFVVLGEMMNWLQAHSGLETATLLDAGCASAYYHEIIQYYVPDWVEYTGLDYSLAMLDLAREKYPGIATIERDLQCTGLDDRSFDIVLSGAALMHIHDWRRALAELTRIADKWLILHRTWVYVDGTPTIIQVGDAYGHPAWYIRFDEKELLELNKQAGFVPVLERLSREGGGGPNRLIKTYVFERQC